MSWHKYLVALIVLLLVHPFLSRGEVVHIGISTPGLYELPTEIARRKGFYKDEGLDVRKVVDADQSSGRRAHGRRARLLDGQRTHRARVHSRFAGQRRDGLVRPPPAYPHRPTGLQTIDRFKGQEDRRERFGFGAAYHLARSLEPSRNESRTAMLPRSRSAVPAIVSPP